MSLPNFIASLSTTDIIWAVTIGGSERARTECLRRVCELSPSSSSTRRVRHVKYWYFSKLERDGHCALRLIASLRARLNYSLSLTRRSTLPGAGTKKHLCSDP